MSTVTRELGRDAAATTVGSRENANIAPQKGRMDEHFGRRIEQDRTWTIYHVYTGVPASSHGENMTGLSRSAATDGMQFLNNRNCERRVRRNGRHKKQHGRLSSFLRAAWSRMGGLSWH
jgi:hypothetical protein